jgi:hypothetical protein
VRPPDDTEGPVPPAPAAAHARLDTAAALAWFDSLAPVDADFMLGSWRGSGVPTGHSMDGMLEAANWYGKEFIDAETVHPLVFTTLDGRKFRVNPALLPLRLAERLPRTRFMTRLFLATRGLVSTRRSAARLRMTRYRGVLSATMIYDAKPINDVFRRIDENAVLGLMDMKGLERPFFFRLDREQGRGPSGPDPG